MMSIKGIFNQTDVEELNPELGFSPRQQELIENSVESLLFREITKDLMQIIEAICPNEKQAEAVKKLMVESLRRRNGQFKALMKPWIKEQKGFIYGGKGDGFCFATTIKADEEPRNGGIRPFARWQNEVMFGQQGRLWVDTDRCSGKTTTAIIASLLRNTLVVTYGSEECDFLARFGVESITPSLLTTTRLDSFKQIIIDDAEQEHSRALDNLSSLINSYPGRIVVMCTRNDGPRPILDKLFKEYDWEVVKP